MDILTLNIYKSLISLRIIKDLSRIILLSKFLEIV